MLTLHRSKGLEFPVVYLPEAWDGFTADADEGRILRLHELRPDGTVGDCVLDVGGEYGPGRAERWARQRQEDAGEDLRLLYVGLTRAKCAVVTWWADSARNTIGSPLHRLLFRPDRTAAPAPTYPVPADPVRELQSRGGWLVEEVWARDPAEGWRPPQLLPDQQVRSFDRDLDLDWRRTSYSALTAAAHGLAVTAPAVGSEVDVGWEDDEVADPGLVPGPAGTDRTTAGLDRVSPMQDLPSGVLFGTAVHAVLETADPTAADLPAELRRVVAGVAAAGQPGEIAVDELTEALLLTFQTPLGPLADDLRLLDIEPADRLAELAFELPLAGGDLRRARPPSAASGIWCRSCASCCPTGIRWPATPTCSPTPPSPARACGAISPAASTPCSGCAVPTAPGANPATSWSTTRPTGSARSTVRSCGSATTPRSGWPPP